MEQQLCHRHDIQGIYNGEGKYRICLKCANEPKVSSMTNNTKKYILLGDDVFDSNNVRIGRAISNAQIGQIFEYVNY